MSMARSMESTAQAVAALSGTIADAEDTVDEVVETGRSLIKMLIFGLIIMTAVGVIVKMVKANSAAEPVAYEPPAAVPEPAATDDSPETTES